MSSDISRSSPLRSRWGGTQTPPSSTVPMAARICSAVEDFGNVARRAHVERATHGGRVLVRRNDHDRDAGLRRAQPQQPGQPVVSGHVEIEQNQFGVAGCFEQRFHGLELSGHFHSIRLAKVFNRLAQRIAKQRVVVSHDDGARRQLVSSSQQSQCGDLRGHGRQNASGAHGQLLRNMLAAANFGGQNRCRSTKRSESGATGQRGSITCHCAIHRIGGGEPACAHGSLR